MDSELVQGLAGLVLVGVAVFAVIYTGVAGDPPIWGQWTLGGLSLAALFAFGAAKDSDGNKTT